MTAGNRLRRIAVLRNTPDWAGNAALWQKEQRLDPNRFLPVPLPPGFPVDTADLILKWNDTFKEDFFSVRQHLKELAVGQLEAAKPDHILTQREFEQDIEGWAAGSVLHFSDDDDFAAPDLFDRVEPLLQSPGAVRWPSPMIADRLSNRRAERYFLRPRFWLHRQVSLRPRKLGWLAHLINGRTDLPLAENMPAFDYFQTNNYAMNATGMPGDRVRQFIDHVGASQAFRRQPLRLHTLTDRYLSVANKLPTSITMLRLMARGDSSDSLASRFACEIEAMAAIEWPEELAWFAPLHKDLVRYFHRTVLSGVRLPVAGAAAPTN